MISSPSIAPLNAVSMLHGAGDVQAAPLPVGAAKR